MKPIVLLILINISMTTLSAQCNNDNHGTSLYESWLSCKKAPSPNVEREAGHWIMIDLGELRLIKDSHIWNYNHSDFSAGVKTLVIDVSMDGESWEKADEIDLTEASYTSSYEGEDIDDIEKVGRYLLLTVKDTYGDGNCAGLSEIKVYTEEAVSTMTQENKTAELESIQIMPNPARQSIHVDFGKEGDKSFQVLSISGNTMYRGQTSERSTYLDVNFLVAGIYILRVQDENGIFTESRFVKM